MGVALLPAQFSSLVLETVLVGIALVFFGVAVFVLKSKRGLFRSFDQVVFIVAHLLLFAIIAHWVVGANRAYSAFVYQSDQAKSIYGNVSDARNVVGCALYVFENVLTNGVIIWRLYLVSDRNIAVTILPCVSNTGLLVAGIGTCYWDAARPDDPALAKWISSIYALSMITNIYSSGLIALLIWNTSRRVRTVMRGAETLHLPRPVYIVIESAVILATFTLASFICYLCNSNLHSPVLAATSPIVGITFCLLIVRAQLGLAKDTSRDTSANSSRPTGLTVGSLPMNNRNSMPAAVHAANPLRSYQHAETHQLHPIVPSAQYRFGRPVGIDDEKSGDNGGIIFHGPEIVDITFGGGKEEDDS